MTTPMEPTINTFLRDAPHLKKNLVYTCLTNLLQINFQCFLRHSWVLMKNIKLGLIILIIKVALGLREV